MDAGWLVGLAESPWLLPALFLLVVRDAFLVVLPSETLVVTLGALWGSTGSPPIVAIVPVAAVGAVVGDLLCFLIGRRVGLGRWEGGDSRLARAIVRARATVLRRPASLVFTARYIPFARIAVNLAAGASGLPLRRFAPLSAAAGVAWACYNTAVGALFGTVLAEVPLVAVAVSIVVAITLGVLVDAAAARLAHGRDT
jgi:membrane protein DedA with SNARE-associated domain